MTLHMLIRAMLSYKSLHTSIHEDIHKVSRRILGTENLKCFLRIAKFKQAPLSENIHQLLL